MFPNEARCLKKMQSWAICDRCMETIKHKIELLIMLKICFEGGSSTFLLNIMKKYVMQTHALMDYLQPSRIVCRKVIRFNILFIYKNKIEFIKMFSHLINIL